MLTRRLMWMDKPMKFFLTIYMPLLSNTHLLEELFWDLLIMSRSRKFFDPYVKKNDEEQM
uniref:Uncharacterized protein n=1 Tax=Brassica campestris TaxID=3711 RepID=A0A3P6A9F0_BRACM|nr:unnamed protein product [Brassica rapa]